MALTLRTIQNDGDAVVDQEGNPLEGVIINFQLVNASGIPVDTWDATTGERVVSEVTSVVTDANGEFSVSLWPNDRGSDVTQYLCTTSLTGTAAFLGTLQEGDLSPIQWITFYANGVPITPGAIMVIYQHLDNAAIHPERTLFTNNRVPSGFIDHTTSTLSLTENVGSVNDKFTVTITGTAFPVYVAGTLYSKSTESITQTGATSKRYYIYYAADGTLSISDSPWDLESESYDGSAPICTVLWDAVTHQGILEEERHHSWRDIHWHHWAHHSVGCRYTAAHHADGLNLSNPGADQYATFSVSAGDLYDEDVRIEIPTTTTCNLFYHHSDGTMRWDKGATAPYKLSAGVPQYDTGTGLAGKTASNTTGYFVSWVYGTNGTAANSNSQIAVVVGQDTNGTMTLAEAQAAALPVLPVDFVVEWKLLWKMIFRWGAGNNLTWISNTDYRTASSLPGGQVTSSNIAANSVTFAAAGDIVATNVQAALEELDTDKTPGANNFGYLNIPQNSQSAAYECVLADSGKHILHPSADTSARTITIPANSSVAYPIGTALTFINQNSAGTLTIAITTDTMRLAGTGTTGSRSLAANGIATAIKITSTEWIISGTGLT